MTDADQARAQQLWESLKCDEDPVPDIAAALAQARAQARAEGRREGLEAAANHMDSRRCQVETGIQQFMTDQQFARCDANRMLLKQLAAWCRAQAKEAQP